MNRGQKNIREMSATVKKYSRAATPDISCDHRAFRTEKQGRLGNVYDTGSAVMVENTKLKQNVRVLESELRHHR
jgi:hypothetical protein